ncbi:MAG TPA: flagellar basal body-associated FliL family protein [Polyangiaceae bacterium]
MEAEHSTEGTAGPGAPKKSKLGLILATVVVLVLVAGAAVAGTMLGPKLVGGGEKKKEAKGAHAEKGAEGHEGEGDGEPKIGETTELTPILVDTRAEDGSLHHLKVVLAVELTEGTPKEEFMKYSLRGREAAVAYLRTQSYDTIAAPERYNDVRAELSKQFTEAVGPSKVARVLITDFVAQ